MWCESGENAWKPPSTVACIIPFMPPAPLLLAHTHTHSHAHTQRQELQPGVEVLVQAADVCNKSAMERAVREHVSR